MSEKHPRLSAAPTGPHAAEDLGEGTNVASWALCGIGILAGAVGSVAVLLLSPILGIIAAVIFALAFVAFAVLNKMGYGTYTHESIDTAEDSPSLGIS